MHESAHLKIKMLMLMISTLILAISCASSLTKQIEVEYDRFEDNTTYQTPEITVKGKAYILWGGLGVSYYNLTVSASKICEGELTDCEPTYFTLDFVSRSWNWYHLEDVSRDLIFLADGQSIEIGVIERVTSSIFSGSDVAEYMLCLVEADVFHILANAVVLEGKLGWQEFSIPFEKRESWRRLAEVPLSIP